MFPGARGWEIALTLSDCCTQLVWLSLLPRFSQTDLGERLMKHAAQVRARYEFIYDGHRKYLSIDIS